MRPRHTSTDCLNPLFFAALLIVDEDTILWFGRRGVVLAFIIGRQAPAGRN
jgi:hypothetical protein